MTDMTTDPDDDLYEPDPAPDYTDADAFFAAEVAPAPPAILHLYERDYPLPASVPLSFTLLLTRHVDDSSLEALQATLRPLFGPDALDYWLERGIDDRRLAIVLGWAIANIRQPGSRSLQDAARAYDAEARGKAPTPPNRAARRQHRRGRGGGRS